MSDSLLKRYRNYLTPQQHGVNCRYNTPMGSYPLHRHDYIEIEYLAQGSIEHELNGLKSRLSAGDCYCLGYSDFHRFTTIEEPLFHNICIYYKDAPPMIQKLLRSAQLPFNAKIPAQDLPQINKWFEELSNHINDCSAYSFEKITTYLTLLLTYFLERSVPLPGKPLHSGYQYIAEAINYISANLTQPLTLPEVAAHVNLSSNYFSKLFTEISGCTFVHYLTLQRIELAGRLLTTTNKSVTDIAFECGFGSFSSFSRAFRQVCGCRPVEFRNL